MEDLPRHLQRERRMNSARGGHCGGRPAHPTQRRGDMRRTVVTALSGLALALAGGLPGTPLWADEAADQAAIAAIWDEYETARVAVDYERWLALWDAGGIKMSQGKPSIPYEMFAELVAPGFVPGDTDAMDIVSGRNRRVRRLGLQHGDLFGGLDGGRGSRAHGRQVPDDPQAPTRRRLEDLSRPCEREHQVTAMRGGLSGRPSNSVTRPTPDVNSNRSARSHVFEPGVEPCSTTEYRGMIVYLPSEHETKEGEA